MAVNKNASMMMAGSRHPLTAVKKFSFFLLMLVILASCRHGSTIAARTVSSMRTATPAKKKPLPVILLAGQSNMEGWGSVEHLRLLINGTSDDGNCPCEYQTLWNGTDFRKRSDVYVQYRAKQGPLSVGYGGNDQQFGPELGLGWTLGDYSDEAMNEEDRSPFVLIKSAYGGKSLAVDFRPPSAGLGNYSDVSPDQVYGYYYDRMIEDFHAALENLTVIYPDYDPLVGYELQNFVWFQGWNDMVRWDFVNDYRNNLLHFIHDVREEFQVPSLPFVIGELGMAGPHPTGPMANQHLAIREAQAQVARELSDTAILVRTTPYVHPQGAHYNRIWHYYGRADAYFAIGKALGRGVLQMIRRSNQSSTSAARAWSSR